MATAIFSGETESSFINDRVRKQNPDQFVFGKKVGLLTKLFGCWHEDVGRPFVQGQTAYRSCLHCGARKQFNAETLETYGAFYFPPIVKKVDFR